MTIAEVLVQRRADRAAAYAALVQQSFAGVEIDADIAERILNDAGKTAEILERDVAILVHRQAIRDSAARHDELSEQIETHRRTIQEADDALEAAAAAHQAQTLPLRAEMARLEAERREFTADAIEKKLFATVPANVRERLDSLQKSINAERASWAVTNAARRVYAAREEFRNVSKLGNPQATDCAREKLARAEQKQSEAITTLGYLQEQYAELYSKAIND